MPECMNSQFLHLLILYKCTKEWLSMILPGVSNCPICDGFLKRYDEVPRLLRTKGGVIERIKIHRWKCINCNSIHREIPNNVYPFKQYESDIIDGVLEGLITNDTIGFEDYPSEMTMKRWKSRN